MHDSSAIKCPIKIVSRSCGGPSQKSQGHIFSSNQKTLKWTSDLLNRLCAESNPRALPTPTSALEMVIERVTWNNSGLCSHFYSCSLGLSGRCKRYHKTRVRLKVEVIALDDQALCSSVPSSNSMSGSGLETDRILILPSRCPVS